MILEGEREMYLMYVWYMNLIFLPHDTSRQTLLNYYQWRISVRARTDHARRCHYHSGVTHSKCSYSSNVEPVTCFYYSGLQCSVWKAVVSSPLPVCSTTLSNVLIVMHQFCLAIQMTREFQPWQWWTVPSHLKNNKKTCKQLIFFKVHDVCILSECN